MRKAEKLAKELFSDADLESISQAIKSFEEKTSGEIVISFNASAGSQPYKTAKRIFEKAKLYETKERNATLIALFLADKKFAVYGDSGIHAKVPEGFWDETVAEMRSKFAAGAMQEGLLVGIRQLGENLAKYFPVATDDVDELSNEIQYGKTDDE